MSADADRAFLDANVLFSAAYRSNAGLLKLWHRPRCQLVTSRYALEETRRNLDGGQRERLEELVAAVELVTEAIPPAASETWGLPPKDVPILAAAILARCSHLLTGDLKHFGSLLGTTQDGVLILRPAEFLRTR